MIKLVLQKLLTALAIIAGVDLIIFLALQSPVFGDPLGRETNFSSDRSVLLSAAKRLGHISSSQQQAWSFRIDGSSQQNYTASMQPNFQVRSGEAVVFETAATATLAELVAAINDSSPQGAVRVSAEVNENYSETPYAHIGLAFLGHKVEVESQHVYQASIVEAIPLATRYIHGFSKLLRLDFGQDYNSRPITHTLWQRGLRSLSIAAPAFIIIFVGAFFMAAAVQRRRRTAKWLNIIAVLCMAVPALLWIFLIRQAVVVDLAWAPLRPFSSPVLPLLVLPVLITAFVGIWPEYLLMRSFIDERMRQPFMLAARAQGISQQRIWRKHLLPTLAGPLAQHVALNLPFLVLGSLLIESIFNIPGLGISVVEAIHNHDSNMLRAITFVIAIAFLFTQFLATYVARRLDPRQRSEGHE
ncbi:MAG: ABC-type dipeptide/oligopeptide/nickel transport system permease component [Myxococcota bacterium]|jgi:ABC-type dipeptide/oligopeptide/nickel transport system permease component